MNYLSILASEAPNGWFLPGDKREFYWGIVAFVVVFGFLYQKVGPIIKKALDKAQASAIDEATSADQLVAGAQAEEAALVAELGDVDAASQRVISEAHATASQLRIDQNAKTQELVNSTWQRAQDEVASLKSQLSADLSTEVAAKALGAAEAVVAGNLDAGTQAQLIEDYIQHVGSVR